MKKDLIHLCSSSDQLVLDVLKIIPEGHVKGIVQISHGMAEHKERYIEFMGFLAKHGYASIIHDHRGHGKSLKSKEDQGYFYDEKANYIVEDLHDVMKYIKKEYPQTPLYLLGHSMGSLVVRKFIQSYDDEIDKLIVCGSPSRNSAVSIALLLVKVLEKVYGDHHRSRLIQTLAFGGYDKKFQGQQENRWLSANQENVKAYNESPDDGFIFTLNGFKNLFTLMKEVYEPNHWKCKNQDLPILFIAGKDDPVIVSKKDWLKAQEFLKARGYQNICSHIYQGMRHEILLEYERMNVFMDILSFIKNV